MFMILRREGERILYWKFRILTLDNQSAVRRVRSQRLANAPSLTLSS